MIFYKMREAVESLIKQIHHHSFNQELSQGILAEETFIHYLIQDTLYLSDYAKALALTASRLPNNDESLQYMQFALNAIKAERHYHVTYIKTHYHAKNQIAEQSPACFMYTNYLLKTASLASVEEAVASLLPCFWVYREVGIAMSKAEQANNPYQEWINLYASEEFHTSVDVAIDITNKVADKASNSIKEKMINAFVRSTQLEWLFWDSAYNQENWRFS